MAVLLHLDSALQRQDSASRELTALFVETWRAEHPEGVVVRRDLAADPLPHLTPEAAVAGADDPLRKELISELEQADAVVIGAPMYNFTIPSTLKAWLDHVIVIGRTAGETSSVAGTPFTFVASRGGSYAPGTPRAGAEFVQNYLETLITSMFASPVDFVVPELTLAPVVPAMAELVPLSEASRAQALADAAAKAKALAVTHAAA
ncbi:FMN-dependent NADH-azoreductase [Streptomyces sp. NPDC060194]|uniref:FMN-dependent NADH-azoreductase n=1 Tax=Streptomyces sp. NPDC060194 TaxID=3347069 RepID=UPI003659749D